MIEPHMNFERPQRPPVVLERTPEEAQFDEQLASWRKHWADKQGVYNAEWNYLLPPPLYDADVIEWQDVCYISMNVILTKEIIENHKAPSLLEAVVKNEERDKRHKETMAEYEKWKASDEYKN